MPAPQALPRLCTFVLAYLLMLPLGASAQAGTISTNLRVDFLHDFSFSDGLDTSVALDLALARSRLVNARLGDWQGLSLSLSYSHSYSFSAIDPGVADTPLANRPLLRIDNQAAFGGPLLDNTPAVSRLLNTWVCSAPTLKCSSNTVGTNRSETLNPVMPGTLAAAADRLAALQLTGSTSTEVLAAGAAALNGNTRVSGFVRLDAHYLAKTPLAYAGDALQASAAAAPATRSLRLAAAATDLQTLRQGVYTSVPDVPSAQRVGLNPEMEQGQALLVAARDSASLLEAPGAGATQYSSRGNLTRQLWDVLALGEPLLGRQRATDGVDPVIPDDAAQLAAFKAALAGVGDASFMAGLGAALAQPLLGGDTPVFILDGQLLGDRKSVV